MTRTFEDEVVQLENEINALKSVYLKTAAVVKMKTVELPAQTFTLDQYVPGQALCSRILKLTVATRDDTNMLCDVTLRPLGAANNYAMNSRQVVFDKQQVGSDYIFKVDVASLNASDIQVIVRGGTVPLTYYFAVTGSSDFTITTEWVYR